MAKRKNNTGKSDSNSATVGYEARLWQMADALRGSMDAAEYKHVVLSLIFLKYISDAFKEQHAHGGLPASQSKAARQAGTFHPDLKGDFILANPPFNVSDWGGERVRDDRRGQHGGGGSGQQQPRPAQAGALPPMVSHPPIVLASINQPNFVPTLPVTPTIEGDPEALLKIKGPLGDPTGERDTKSNGPGRGGAMGNGDGLGIGDGKGGGALKGEDGNVGGKRNQQGCCGQGGTGGSGQAYTTRPVITYKEKAQYTEEAPKNGVMGVVVLSAVFGEDGEIYDIRPVRQLPDGLTEEAIRALRKIRFRPATKNGTPVSVRMNIEFSFTIF